MRLRRTAVTAALAVLPLVAMTTPAHAAGCPLLSDPAGDSHLLGVVPSPNTDIVSVDVASGPTSVAAVMRVASLDPTVLGQLGMQWAVGWNIGANRYELHASAPSILGNLNGTNQFRSSFELNGQSLGPVPFAIDVVNDHIAWTIPRSLLPDLATPGATFSTFGAIASVFSSSTDALNWEPVTYVDQTPGCIPAA